MEVVRIILLVIDVIICFALIVLMLLQSDSTDGASAAISGGSSEGYLNNNADRSREGRLRRITIVAGIAFMIITYTLSLLYISVKDEKTDNAEDVSDAQQQEGLDNEPIAIEEEKPEEVLPSEVVE